MVTQDAFEPHLQRARWLRRAGAAAFATAVVGIGGTGLVVAVVAAKQPAAGTTASTDSGSSGSSSDGSGDTGSSSSGGSSSDNNSSSGLGTTQQDAPTQGGSHGS
ncbi:hypothetical protein [Kribbella sp. NPDC006257]|uniref:hypothetical protein n=1 Tax=Kribbella sp. NPDC006257 TaxID=3156738 RepID=UPI0033A784AB